MAKPDLLPAPFAPFGDDAEVQRRNEGICPAGLTDEQDADGQHCRCWWEEDGPCCRCGWNGGSE